MTPNLLDRAVVLLTPRMGEGERATWLTLAFTSRTERSTTPSLRTAPLGISPSPVYADCSTMIATMAGISSPCCWKRCERMPGKSGSRNSRPSS
jgi:hypothetical protein